MEPFDIIDRAVNVVHSNPGHEPIKKVCIGLTRGPLLEGLKIQFIRYNVEEQR